MTDNILSDKEAVLEQEVKEVSGGNNEDLPVLACPACKSTNTELQGSRFNRATMTRTYDYRCRDCGKWFIKQV